ncbi:hypothetical protein BDV28DRAFT_140920 [Aspergillus coremiiformis]|uniref:N-acetylgalactosaminide beta-1,3-galactosyltransferase n=1 Tax=Aspergillus coremiiformis TaxID=138285 RepID=A0A5N6YVX5_9EURO|nr:hypothetical protein BDV28DRAFT_140920 [Aspergillus coremiiformis]
MARLIASRKFTNILVFILLVAIGTSVLRINLPDASLNPVTIYHHRAGQGKLDPDYWEWETTTRFVPQKKKPVISHAIPFLDAGEDPLCDSFPTYLLSRIQVVLKIGTSEPADRVDTQLATVTRCIPNLLVVSDREGELHGHRVHDILATLPESFRFNTSDFEAYDALQRGGTTAVESAQGWRLDRFKFLPMVERAYETNPTAQWYVFLESDTYYVWDNLFRLLDQYDPSEQLYFGSPSPGRSINDDGEKMYFAYGGAGFVLSGAAVKKLVSRHHGSLGQYVEPSLSLQYEQMVKDDCCGDSVLGWALYEKGIKLSGLWPMFNPHPLHGIPFDNAYWCQPVISMHKTLLSDMTALIKWENQRDRKTPLLYADLFEFQKLGTFDTKAEWDNGDWGGFREPDDSPAHTSMDACRIACHKHTECLSYTYDDIGNCIFVPTIRLGHSTPATKEVRLSAGWDVEKIQDWRASHQCERPMWVKPSLTRIF